MNCGGEGAQLEVDCGVAGVQSGFKVTPWRTGKGRMRDSAIVLGRGRSQGSREPARKEDVDDGEGRKWMDESTCSSFSLEVEARWYPPDVANGDLE